MQLESHATPPRETPQQRYANLHRAIERGLDTDDVWRELAEVSALIGHRDEAVRCARHVRNDTLRFAVESRLAQLGLRPTPAKPARAGGAAAASAAAAGGGNEPNRLRDHVVDALQYLFHQQMPWLVLVTTLAFPLVVGVGGFLTAGGSPLLLTAIAAVPGLCVVALVGAMGRQILLTSAEGNGDVPPIPGFAELVVDAKRFFVDAALVFGCLLGPSLLALWLGAPLSTTLPGLAVGALLAPMAWSLRHLHGTLGALSPVTLLRAVARGGAGYVGVAAVTCALFTPGAAVAWIAFGKPVWVQIAIVGPLCVVPLYLSSRLIGTWLDSNRHVLRGCMAVAHSGAPPAAAPAPEAPATRRPRRPETLQHFTAPVVGRHAAARAPAAPVRAASDVAAPAATGRPAARAAAGAPGAAAAAPVGKPAGAPRSIEGRGPAVRAAEAAAALRGNAAQAAGQPRPPAPAPADPAARTVVRGRERQRSGAAAKRP